MLSTVKAALGDVRVVAEGENYTPKGMQEYPIARFSVIPRETVFQTLAFKEEAGLTAITLYFSRALNTIDEALELAETVKNAFPPQNTQLDDGNQLLVLRTWIEAVRHEDNVFGIPIFIRWSNPNA